MEVGAVVLLGLASLLALEAWFVIRSGGIDYDPYHPEETDEDVW